MKNLKAAEFYFVGACVLPPMIVAAGDAGLAILVFTFLILAGAVCAIADPEAPHRKPPEPPH
jgi:hypothetical protein